MPAEPAVKRAIAFVDGQNLFYAVKYAFGYTFPNYDVPALATAICGRQGWESSGVRFYTGIPSLLDNPSWNHFWGAKLARMGTRGVVTYSRDLKYRNQTVKLLDGETTTVLVGQEKGIDIRLKPVHILTRRLILPGWSPGSPSRGPRDARQRRSMGSGRGTPTGEDVPVTPHQREDVPLLDAPSEGAGPVHQAECLLPAAGRCGP